MNNSNNNKITTIEVTQDTLDSLRKFAKPGDETFKDIIQGLIEYRLEDRNTSIEKRKDTVFLLNPYLRSTSVFLKPSSDVQKPSMYP